MLSVGAAVSPTMCACAHKHTHTHAPLFAASEFICISSHLKIWKSSSVQCPAARVYMHVCVCWWGGGCYCEARRVRVLAEAFHNLTQTHTQG